jgi:hypothetical protein
MERGNKMAKKKRLYTTTMRKDKKGNPLPRSLKNKAPAIQSLTSGKIRTDSQGRNVGKNVGETVARSTNRKKSKAMTDKVGEKQYTKKGMSKTEKRVKKNIRNIKRTDMLKNIGRLAGRAGLLGLPLALVPDEDKVGKHGGKTARERITHKKHKESQIAAEKRGPQPDHEGIGRLNQATTKKAISDSVSKLPKAQERMMSSFPSRKKSGGRIKGYKKGGPITYRMTGGQVVDNSYD